MPQGFSGPLSTKAIPMHSKAIHYAKSLCMSACSFFINLTVNVIVAIICWSVDNTSTLLIFVIGKAFLILQIILRLRIVSVINCKLKRRAHRCETTSHRQSNYWQFWYNNQNNKYRWFYFIFQICFSGLKYILTSNAAPQQTLVCPPMNHNRRWDIIGYYRLSHRRLWVTLIKFKIRYLSWYNSSH